MEKDLQLSIENFKELFNNETLKAKYLYYLLNIYDSKNEFPNLKRIAEELAKEDSNGEEQDIIIEPFINYIYSLNNEIRNELIPSRFHNILQNKKRLDKFLINKRKEIKNLNLGIVIKKLLPLKNGKLFLIQIDEFLLIFDSHSFQIITVISMSSSNVFELKNKNLFIEKNNLKILDKNKYSIYKEIGSPGIFYYMLELSNGNILFFYENNITGNYYDYNLDVIKETRIELKLFNNNLELISSKTDDYHFFSDAFQINENYYSLLHSNKKIVFYSIENNEIFKSFNLAVNSYWIYDKESLFLFGCEEIFILNQSKFEIIQKIKDISILGFYFFVNKEYIILKENNLNICGYFICKIDGEFHFIQQEDDSLSEDYFINPIHLQRGKIAFSTNENHLKII